MKATDITNLIEQYDSRIKVYDQNFEIFGPTVSGKDLNAAGRTGKVIRFIAFLKSEEMWVWNAHAAVHGDVFQVKKFGNIADLKRLLFTNKVLLGVANKKGGKWVMFSGDQMEGKPFSEYKILIKNFKWVDKYINVTTWLNSKATGVTQIS